MSIRSLNKDEVEQVSGGAQLATKYVSIDRTVAASVIEVGGSFSFKPNPIDCWCGTCIVLPGGPIGPVLKF